MEEEQVEVKVQEEEVEDRGEQSDDRREQTITQTHDTWMVPTLEPTSCDKSLQVRTNTGKK